MTYRDWRNLTCALSFIDRDAFEAALSPACTRDHRTDERRWQRFRDDTIPFMLSTDNTTAEAIFAIAARSVTR